MSLITKSEMKGVLEASPHGQKPTCNLSLQRLTWQASLQKAAVTPTPLGALQTCTAVSEGSCPQGLRVPRTWRRSSPPWLSLQSFPTLGLGPFPQDLSHKIQDLLLGAPLTLTQLPRALVHLLLKVRHSRGKIGMGDGEGLAYMVE